MILLDKNGNKYQVKKKMLPCPLVEYDPDTGYIECKSNGMGVPNFDVIFKSADGKVTVTITDAADTKTKFETLTSKQGFFVYQATRSNYISSKYGNITIYKNSEASKKFNYKYPLYTIDDYKGPLTSNQITIPTERNLSSVINAPMSFANCDLDTYPYIQFLSDDVMIKPSDNDAKLKGLLSYRNSYLHTGEINFTDGISLPHLEYFVATSNYTFPDCYDLGTIFVPTDASLNLYGQYHTMPTETAKHTQKFLYGNMSDNMYLPNGLYDSPYYKSLAYEDPVAGELRHHLYPTSCFGHSDTTTTGSYCENTLANGEMNAIKIANGQVTTSDTYVGYFGSNIVNVYGNDYTYLTFVISEDVIGLRIIKGIDPASTTVSQTEKDKKTYVFVPCGIIPQDIVRHKANNAITGHNEDALGMSIPMIRLNGLTDYSGVMYVTPITIDGIQEDKTIMATHVLKDKPLYTIAPQADPNARNHGGGIIVDPDINIE